MRCEAILRSPVLPHICNPSISVCSTGSLYSASNLMTTSSNETFSALLAICAGNSPVTGEFLRLNKRLSKQSWGWWFETPSRSLWRQCYVTLQNVGSSLSLLVTTYSESSNRDKFSTWSAVMKTGLGWRTRWLHLSPKQKSMVVTRRILYHFLHYSIPQGSGWYTFDSVVSVYWVWWLKPWFF